jgi:hypothetical protein
MSEVEGVILGFDVRRGGEDEPFKDVRRGEGVIFDFLRGRRGGMDQPRGLK